MVDGSAAAGAVENAVESEVANNGETGLRTLVRT